MGIHFHCSSSYLIFYFIKIHSCCVSKIYKIYEISARRARRTNIYASGGTAG